MEVIGVFIVLLVFFWLLILPIALLAQISDLRQMGKDQSKEILKALQGLQESLTKTAVLRGDPEPGPASANPEPKPLDEREAVPAQPVYRQTPPATAVPLTPTGGELTPHQSEPEAFPESTAPAVFSSSAPPADRAMTPSLGSLSDALVQAKALHSHRVMDPIETPSTPAFETDPGKPPPSAPVETPSPFEKAAHDILNRIWNWIIVGQENLPAGVSWEFAMASHWLMRVGVVVLVLGLGFFVRYSIERDWISPLVRVLLTAGAGLLLLGGGGRLLRGAYAILGQGLMGGGIATLYFSSYAASPSFYALVDTNVSFAMMAGITLLCGIIAVRADSLLFAILGVLGGYGTPVVLPTPSFQFLPLLVYLAFLGFGVLAIRLGKPWPLAQYLAFFCHSGLFSRALVHFQSEDLWLVLSFAILHFLLFAAMAIGDNLSAGKRANLLDLAALALATGFFFLWARIMIWNEYGSEGLALVSFGLALFFAGMALFYARWRTKDQDWLSIFVGFSCIFWILVVPLWLSSSWWDACWGLMAVTMIALGQRLGSHFLRIVAQCLLLFVLYHLFAFVGPDQYGRPLKEPSLSEFAWFFAKRTVSFGIPLACLFASARLLLKNRSPNDATQAETVPLTEGGIFLGCFFVAFFGYLFLEINRTVGYLHDPLRLPALSWLFLAAAAMVLWGMARGGLNDSLGKCLLVGLFGVLLVKLFVWDFRSWNPQPPAIFESDRVIHDAVLRNLDTGSVVLGLLCVGWFFASRAHARSLTPVFIGSGLLLLWNHLTWETLTLLHYLKVPNLGPGGVSIVWTIYALILVHRGIIRRWRWLRFFGLGLLLLVAIKVFTVDMSALDAFNKIIAFLILGVLLLFGSFLYLRFDRPTDPGVTGKDPTEAGPIGS